MYHRRHSLHRRGFLKLGGMVVGSAAAALACGKGADLAQPTGAAAPTQLSSGATAPPGPTVEPTPRPPTLADLRPVITFNDYVPEQVNYVDTLVIVVNYTDLPERVFDMAANWHRVFGTDDPHTELNAYYRENFYGQLQLRPVSAPGMTDPGYVQVTFEGSPEDYLIGWLIGMEHESLESVNPDMVRKVMLDLVAGTVEQYPDFDYQDKLLFVVLNATGAEYGRGAMGALPTGAVYDLFIGDIGPEDADVFSDPATLRVVETSSGTKLVGLISTAGYTFDQYFADRQARAVDDQFLLGMAIFGTEAPLSCASHDILHGLRRRSASASPPEGRMRAIDCLYNLSLQSQWTVGTDDHGMFDRSVNCSPYIGWWDPMGDHLHPRDRDFFSSHPHGMCAFTKLRMGFIPPRCLTTVEADEADVRLAPLSSPQLPAPGSGVETLAVRMPLIPGLPESDQVYVLLEYRRRPGASPDELHPDQFSITPDHAVGDPSNDPGYNSNDPAASVYINPPMQFVPSEGVLVYFVNERIPHIPAAPYTEWYNFPIALLNPAGNDLRDNLNEAALDAGESITVDFSNFYADRGVGIPVRITVTVTARTAEYAEVRLTRERL
jgi:hypothetical protein